MNNSDISRRDFLLGSVAATVSMLLASCGYSDQPGAEDLDALTLSATRLPTWVARKADPSDDGTELSNPEVILPVDAWHSAVVPGTVLATLVASGQVPDPYFGLNNEQITDLHPEVDEYVYWFVSDFRLDSADWANAESVWLRFRGINYSAKVYLNGTELTPDDPLTGMFLRHELNITKAIRRGANNRLAVLVTPPQPAGHPVADLPYTPGSSCQDGDRRLGESVTAQYTGGWDFVAPVRDRCTGIWDVVNIVGTGPVSFDSDPHLRTSITWQGDAASSVSVTLTATVRNTTSSPEKGVVDFEVGEHRNSASFDVPASGTETVTTTVIIETPVLWWPNGRGEQHLYQTAANIQVKGRISDTYSHRLGIREISSGVDPETTGRMFHVNKKKLFVRGGCWTFPDAMLRHSAKNYEDQVRHHAMMNFNMIRVWGGGITERPEFYEACSRHGLLVWQEFWITDDCNRFSWRPEDHELFLRCAADTVAMLRNHTSLALWVGGNEGPPPGDLKSRLPDTVRSLDPDRDYVSFSTEGDAGFGLPGTQWSDGPYGIRHPKEFFTNEFAEPENRRGGPEGPPVAFLPEFGSVGMPVVETLRSIMPPQDYNEIPHVTFETWSDLNEDWGLHTYIPFFNKSDSDPRHVPNQVDLYGTPDTIEAFCEQAQAAQYQQYKALFEGHNSHMWSWYTGGLMWRSNTGWSGLRGGLYDMFLEPTAGYFGARLAGEKLHAQLNLSDGTIEVVNNLSEPAHGLTIDTVVCDSNGHIDPSLSRSFEVSDPVPGFTTAKVATRSDLFSLAGTHVVRLRLTQHGAEIGRNLDWISSSDSLDKYRELRQLPAARLEARVTDRAKNAAIRRVALELANPGNVLAFFVRLQVVSGSGDRVLPVFWSDNYLSVLPEADDIAEVSMAFSSEDGENLHLRITGWNIEPQSIPL